jgi:hypothetical protein
MTRRRGAIAATCRRCCPEISSGNACNSGAAVAAAPAASADEDGRLRASSVASASGDVTTKGSIVLLGRGTASAAATPAASAAADGAGMRNTDAGWVRGGNASPAEEPPIASAAAAIATVESGAAKLSAMGEANPSSDRMRSRPTELPPAGSTPGSRSPSAALLPGHAPDGDAAVEAVSTSCRPASCTMLCACACSVCRSQCSPKRAPLRRRAHSAASASLAAGVRIAAKKASPEGVRDTEDATGAAMAAAAAAAEGGGPAAPATAAAEKLLLALAPPIEVAAPTTPLPSASPTMQRTSNQDPFDSKRGLVTPAMNLQTCRGRRGCTLGGEHSGRDVGSHGVEQASGRGTSTRGSNRTRNVNSRILQR